MLKIALPTFKNDENHTQYGKILYENGKMVVRRWWLGGVFSAYTYLISCILVTKVVKWWCDDGGWLSGSGVYKVYLR